MNSLKKKKIQTKRVNNNSVFFFSSLFRCLPISLSSVLVFLYTWGVIKALSKRKLDRLFFFFVKKNVSHRFQMSQCTFFFSFLLKIDFLQPERYKFRKLTVGSSFFYFPFPRRRRRSAIIIRRRSSRAVTEERHTTHTISTQTRTGRERERQRMKFIHFGVERRGTIFRAQLLGREVVEELNE